MCHCNHFWDKDNNGFYFTSDLSEELIIRSKEVYDGAIPSGNSVSVNNYLRLLNMKGGSNDIYVSIDLDVMDPGFAPGVGNPEANGMTSREIFDFIYCLENFKLTGFDIVELIPSYDDGSTSALAARLLAELICIAES